MSNLSQLGTQKRRDHHLPLMLDRTAKHRLFCPAIPIRSIKLIALITVQHGMNPGAIVVLARLRLFMCRVPVSACGMPQRSKTPRPRPFDGPIHESRDFYFDVHRYGKQRLTPL